MSNAGNLVGAFLVGATLGMFDGGDETVVQDLYDDGYEPEEIVDELGIDEEEVREIVGEEYKDYDC